MWDMILRMPLLLLRIRELIRPSCKQLGFYFLELILMRYIRLPVLTDANVPRRSLSSSLFPGVSSSVGVHDGFGDVQEK